MKLSSLSPKIATGWVLDEDVARLSSARPLQLRRHTHAIGVPRHSHIFTELVLIQSGTITHNIFDNQGELQTIDLQAGDFLVIPPGLEHAYLNGELAQDCQRTDICFLADWFLGDLTLIWSDDLLPLFFASHLFHRIEDLQIWQFKLTPEEMMACERELNEIATEYQQANPSPLLIRSIFLKVLVHLARAWRRALSHAYFHFRPEIWSALHAIDSAIEAGRVFHVEAFAHQVGISAKHFSRLFQSATGITPSEYFGRRRTQHVGYLLLGSDLSIGEIAGRLGFCDSAHLSRTFRKEKGVSPRAFRLKHKQEPSRSRGRHLIVP